MLFRGGVWCGGSGWSWILEILLKLSPYFQEKHCKLDFLLRGGHSSVSATSDLGYTKIQPWNAVIMVIKRNNVSALAESSNYASLWKFTWITWIFVKMSLISGIHWTQTSKVELQSFFFLNIIKTKWKLCTKNTVTVETVTLFDF